MADSFKDSALFNKLTKDTVDMAKKLGREFKKMSSSFERTLKSADSLSVKLEKMEDSSKKTGDRWKKHRLLLAGINKEAKEAVESQEKQQNISKLLGNQAKKRIKHGHIIANLMKKETIFSTMRFKFSKMIHDRQVKRGKSTDKELQTLYETWTPQRTLLNRPTR